MSTEEQQEVPCMIFLAGPPGSGKTSVGSRACERLGLEFRDLSAPEPWANDEDAASDELQGIIANRSADVVALSWGLQQDTKILASTRRSGELVLLWAHPHEMQSRSGQTEELFTPVGRLKTKGGFGRNGTGCREFRRLDRASTESVLLVGMSLDEAVTELQEWIHDLRAFSVMPPVQREGLDRWVDNWVEDCSASRPAAMKLADAMARYTLHLRAQGKSPRTLSGVYSDLDAAGMLVFMYESPSADSVLRGFRYPPCTYEYKRKFSDSPSLTARYRRNLNGFAQYLEETGLIPKDGDR